MTPRRRFLKSITSFAFGAPVFSQAAAAQGTRAATAVPGLPSPDAPEYWTRVRDQFLLARDKTFFNPGTIGAMPKVVLDRTVEHLHKIATDVADWDYRGEQWIAGYSEMESIRAKAARLLNADTKEIALTENVTTAMSYVGAGLKVEPGTEILMSDQEHVGGEGIWLTNAKRYGATMRRVALPKPAHSPGEIMDILRREIRPETKVIALSHIITGSGAILPVKEICAEARSRGIFTVLDGAQTFGQIKIDLKDIGCDAYVGCFHKWMLAPAGTGFLYVRSDRADEIWSTLASRHWDNHEDSGFRFTQRGTGSLSLLMGLDAALDFHNEIGPERVYARIKYLGEYLRERLKKIPRVTIYSPSDATMCAGMTVYGVEGYDGAQLQDEMWNRGRLRPRASSNIGVRQCTHIFNSTEEIDRALEIVRTLARA